MIHNLNQILPLTHFTNSSQFYLLKNRYAIFSIALLCNILEI